MPEFQVGRVPLRRDIQFLRGIAVASVVWYHAGMAGAANGFLGVDVFFVVSGFLITGLILSGLDEGRFSFIDFYTRRARRLLPALYSTLLLTTGLAFLVLTNSQWEDYRLQLYGSITFTANMVLPFQVGYFDAAAESRPLLHVWSLSLEEQFYLVVPFLLWGLQRNYRGLVIAGLAVASFVLCQAMLAERVALPFFGELPSAEMAFYSLPSRAWELLAGSLVAWIMLRYPGLRIAALWKWVSLVGLGFFLCVPLDTEHPRWDALAVVALTSILIAGADDWLPDWFGVRLVERVGDISYSLYLLHWPLLAFAYVGYLGDVPQAARLSMICLALMLAIAQYRLVEQRFRYFPKNARMRAWAPLLVTTALLVAISLPGVGQWVGRDFDNDEYAEFRRPNFGLDPVCSRRGPFQIDERCRESEQPRTVLWGDSFAMHLVQGLQENPETRGELIQLTRSNCNPASGMAVIRSGIAQAKACLEFNRAALSYILASPDIEKVIISSPFGYFYSGFDRLYEEERGEYESRKSVAALASAVVQLEESGKEVLLVSPLPRASFDVGECLERRGSAALLLLRRDCDIDHNASLRRQRPVLEGLREVQSLTGVRVLWLSDWLCESGRCAAEIDGVGLYRDPMHMSHDGSRAFVSQLPLFAGEEEL